MAHAADVFVSYSSQDKHRVFPMIERLRSTGVTVWVDQGGIDGAVLWSEEIVEAIESCKVLMLMVSSSSVSSHNVVKEVALSSERKKHILPVYLERVELPKALQYPLAGIQHVEHVEDTEVNFQSVLRSLTRMGVSVMTGNSPPSAGGQLPKASTPTLVSGGPMLLAVLPFENISPEKDTDYFSDGLTEELIMNLSKLSEIKVVSRTTTMHYKGTKKNTKTIASELGVQYILEGSVRRIGDNLRITSQLVEVSTDAHIWGETYKGTMADVFDIQERVAKEIADALKLKLTPTEQAVLTKRATIVPEAFDAALRAKYFLYRATERSLRFAIDLFQRAIALDSRYAEAYAGLGFSRAMLYLLYERDETLPDKAIEASLRALMYDNSLSDAYAALGLAYMSKGDLDDAAIACEKAVELDQQSFFNFYVKGRVMSRLERFEDAVSAFRESAKLNPKFHVTLNALRMCLDTLKRSDESRVVLEQLVTVLPEYIAENPDDARAAIAYALNLAQLGRVEEARRSVLTALDLSPNDSMLEYYAACLYAAIGDYDLAVSALSNSIRAGWKDIEYMKYDPDLDSIRNHPGYIELMKGR